MEIISPYKVKKILFQRNYPGYLYRRELIDDSEYGGNGELEMICCYSTCTGHWIGNAKDARHLCKKYGVRNLQRISKYTYAPCSIGFNEQEQKWYGWSHRAIFGFGIGSKVDIGSCAYTPKDEADSIAHGIRFWSDEDRLNVRAGEITEEDGRRGVSIIWEYSKNIPNEKLREKISSVFWDFPDEYGRGEWIAETLEDAKQMAIDFANGIS